MKTYSGLDKAIEVMSVAFAGKFDKGGTPYALHCVYVMRKVAHLGTEAMIAAVLHDLLEDTGWTVDLLIEAGFHPRTVGIITLVTHLKGEAYMDYIGRLSVSAIAVAIKMADLRHNSDIHRMKGLTDKDFARLAKYHKAYAFLREVAA